jgi:elongation factor Ts
MANFSLEDVKTLRERLGTGMVDTKNALVEADGDIEKAVEILRLKGAKGNAKRADRSTSEGLIAVVESATAVTMIELACETDFVAKNEKFIALAEKVVQALADSGAETVDAALAVSADGGTVGSLIEDQAAIIGEKIELRRVSRIAGEKFAVYLSREDVPAAEVENERRIVEQISREEGKPDAALPKIVEGRVGAFYKQVALLEQDYARDNKLVVGNVAKDAGLNIVGFARFKVGA